MDLYEYCTKFNHAVLQNLLPLQKQLEVIQTSIKQQMPGSQKAETLQLEPAKLEQKVQVQEKLGTPALVQRSSEQKVEHSPKSRIPSLMDVVCPRPYFLESEKTVLPVKNSYKIGDMSHISHDTNSQDPDKIRSRVFVRNLKPTMTRDKLIELFANFGTITGASLHTNYAFVQFTTEDEALLAEQVLDNFEVERQRISVRNAFYSGTNQGPNQNRGQKRAYPRSSSRHDSAASTPNHSADSSIVGVPAATPAKPLMSINMNATAPGPALPKIEQITDVFICGGCRYTTNFLERFVDHRRTPCTRRTPKEPNEPGTYKCFSCPSVFDHAWNLLYHMRQEHEVTMYKAS